MPTPFLLADVERVQNNINRVADAMRSSDIDLRPHWKTTKSIEVAELQLRAGARGFTCATAAELQALVAGGIEDVFWAYPPVGLDRAHLAAATSKQIRVSVGLDSFQAAQILSRAAAQASTTVDVLLEVDVGLGRTGVDPAAATELGRAVHALPGLRLRGTFAHEGHVGSVRGELKEREAVAREAARTLVAASEAMRAHGIQVDVVSIGSTPGVTAAPFVDGITEARPGTYVFGDDNQYVLKSIPPSGRAIRVVCTVVSLHKNGHAIVDAGLKSLSSDQSIRGDGRLGTTETGGAWITHANEEHGFLAGPETESIRIGDRVELVPNHACGTVNMWTTVEVAQSREHLGSWKTLGRH